MRPKDTLSRKCWRLRKWWPTLWNPLTISMTTTLCRWWTSIPHQSCRTWKLPGSWPLRSLSLVRSCLICWAKKRSLRRQETTQSSSWTQFHATWTPTRSSSISRSASATLSTPNRERWARWPKLSSSCDKMSLSSKTKFKGDGLNLSVLKSVSRASKMWNLSTRKSMSALRLNWKDSTTSTWRSTPISTTLSMSWTCTTSRMPIVSRRPTPSSKSLRTSMPKTNRMRYLRTRMTKAANSSKCVRLRPDLGPKLAISKREA